MILKRKILFLCSILSVTIFHSTSVLASSSFDEYHSYNQIFSFRNPIGWKVSEVNELTIISKAFQKKTYPSRFSIIVQLMPQPATESQYLAISLKQLQNAYSDFKLIKIDTVLFCGKRSVAIEGCYSEKGNKLHGYSVFSIDKSHVFLFNGIAQDIGWNSTFEKFKKVIASIRIKLPDAKTKGESRI